MNFCHTNKVISEFVRFDPNIDNHSFLFTYYAIQQNRETVRIDLQKAYEEIWAGYEGRCRTAIRKAVKTGVSISEDVGPDEVNAFFEIYQKEMERKADSNHYFFNREFFHELATTMGDKFKYFLAYYEGKLCGGTIIYFGESTVYDFLMATSLQYWKYQPNNILLDYAVKWAKSKGFKLFDLMGGREGVFKFKSSFSSLRSKFYTGKKIYNPEIYSELEKISKKIAHNKFRTEFFPVYRQLEDLNL
jgi:lipid II:glycine glycyltransferase (peptidoglycan interpeptide bridge formation enzyme)